MNAILICPADRSEVSALSERTPLAAIPLLGTPLICRWLEHLASLRATHVTILASDRPEQIRALVGNGSRWGLSVNVVPETHEFSCEEARQKYSSESEGASTVKPHTVVVDHLPGDLERDIFASYADFFNAVQSLLGKPGTLAPVGTREIQPGVWAGLHSQISPQAILKAPCWIGANVLVKADAEIGPGAIVESGVIVETGSTVSASWIGENTFVGELTDVENSLVVGNILINHQSESVVKIPDPFLIGLLQGDQATTISSSVLGRIAALIVLLGTLPFALITILIARWNGQRAFIARRAAVPVVLAHGSSSIIYHEFSNVNGWWKRWPQLWNVACGQFAWIGNRPITPLDAGKLADDFEKLWLSAPIGLISQGDAEGCPELDSAEARAHAAFYATQANWRLNLRIFCRAMLRLAQRKFLESPVVESEGIKNERYTLAPR